MRVRVSWGWVKTYCYHIWRNNHPLTSYFRAPRVPRVLTHNQLRLKINILDLSGNCLTGAGETLAEALGVVASARLGVSSREWFDNFFAPQDPVSLSSQSGWAIDFFYRVSTKHNPKTDVGEKWATLHIIHRSFTGQSHRLGARWLPGLAVLCISYPLVMTNIAIEHGHRNSGFTH